MTALEAADRMAAAVNTALAAAESKAKATTDDAKAEALANRGGVVLIGPPRLRWDRLDDQPVRSWRVTCAVRDGAGGRRAWADLDDLVRVVAGVLYVESADPTQWRPTAAADPLPAYLLTLSDETE